MDWTKIKETAATLQARRTAQGEETPWRSLEELAGTPEFRALLAREFAVPPEASDHEAGLRRRDFLKLIGGTLGLAGLAGVAGCTVRPRGKIVPYVNAPEHLVPGNAVYYATALEFCGFGRGVLVETHEGRPTKIEGNPEHPASLGATSIFEQAAILDLYNPARSSSVLKKGEPDSWPAFLGELQEALSRLPPDGAGLHLLTGTTTSPSFGDQWETLRRRYPAAQWHCYEPIHRDNAFAAAKRIFGAEAGGVEPQYRFDKARVIVSFGADFLFAMPGSLRYARDLMAGRDVRDPARGQAGMNRLYVLESAPSITGAYADERRAVRPGGAGGMGAHVAALAARLGVDTVSLLEGVPGHAAHDWAKRVAGDLRPGSATLLIAGTDQPVEIQAAVHAMNARLGNFGNTIVHAEPVQLGPAEQTASLKALADAIGEGNVRILLMLGGNWARTAPSDFDFAAAIRRVPLTIHSGLYRDETADAATWHLPQAHPLEAWGDTRAFDGTATIVQPMIEPLYGGRSPHEVLDTVAAFPGRRSYEIVRGYWVQPGRLSEEAWKRALHDGVVPQSAARLREVAPGPASPIAIDLHPAEGLDLLLSPDGALWDGRYGQNAWLQELPRPITKLSWENAFLVGPATAERLELNTGDVVRLQMDDYRGQISAHLEGAVLVQPGVADGVISLSLGGGSWSGSRDGGDHHGGPLSPDPAPRRKNGPTAENGTLGIDAYPIRSSLEPWRRQVVLQKLGRRQELVMTQHHHLVDGRDLVRMGTLAELTQRHPRHDEAPTTLYNLTRTMTDGVAWAMVIDLTRCIACNACVLACQAENNIPPVGAAEVARGREMHWLRIDAYYFGDPGQPAIASQPVACMHCETAPCELVCPVAATVHDSEGLNLQIYNRCIGTRYCSNNCPYKVRRFNFFRYAEAAAKEPLLLMANPDVTVRARGVMEKCTYCVQRISEARIRASIGNRPIRDGEVIPACAQACPTETILFGNRNDPESRVTKLKESPLNYSLLGDLNTLPRTTYLARVRNPAPPAAT